MVLPKGAPEAIAIIEAGISEAGEMEKLQSMIQPTAGLFTNLGSAHDAGFESRQHKASEKWLLFSNANWVLYQKENMSSLFETAPAWLEKHGAALYDWSYADASAAISIELESSTQSDWVNDWHYQSQIQGLESGQLPCPYRDEASRQNLIHSSLAALLLLRQTEAESSKAAQITPGDKLAQSLRSLPAPVQRMQVYAGKQGCVLIDDSYSADKEGLKAALEFMSQHRLEQMPLICILGPLSEQSGGHSAGFEEVLDMLRATAPAQILAVGEAWLPFAVQMQAEDWKFQHFEAPEDCIQSLRNQQISNSIILIKGPRAFQFERISQSLRERSHEARLELELGALAHNIAAYRHRIGPEVKICVMVKAEAYGSGGLEIARFFEKRGVDYLAVAYVDEGVSMREGGIELPIIVANTLPGQWDLLRQHQLEPEITFLAQLQEYTKHFFGNHSSKDTEVPALHLKLDTGMHRLGFDVLRNPSPEFDAMLDLLGSRPFRVASVFSHLSASEMPEADAFSLAQNEYLLKGLSQIESVLGYKPMVHILNSVGALRLPALRHDMVRLGLGIYGIGLSRWAPGLFEPAHRMVAQIVQIRAVPAGEVVGYGLGGKADHERMIAVVNIGYADGLRRAAGHGAYSLWVQDRAAPIVGSVCMDFTMIDISDIPEARVGDEVEIFGRHLSVESLAAVCQTIPYEIFTGIGSRVRRLYYR